jgi:hypothetical protein
MKALHSISAAIVLCIASAAPAMAQGTTFTNGNFAGGSLASWTTDGDVLVVGTNKVAALTTASVEFQDDLPLDAGFNNNSGTAAVDFSSAPNLAGVSFASLDTAGGEATYEGSAIRQDFFATAGDTLTVKFDWTFLSTETGTGTKADFGFLAINGTVFKFVDAFSAPVSSQFNSTFGDFNQVSWGWANASYTYTAASTGAVSLVLGVVDVGDYNSTSELRIDNISVSAVPEPESYAMLLAGLGLMGAIARKRRIQG